MPTALSSTELPGRLRSELRAVADVAHLVRFRAGTVRRRRAVLVGGVFLLLTLAAIVAPTLLPGAGRLGDGRARDLLTLLPTAYAGFQLLSVVAGVASGGGRELVPREQLVAYPVSPTTDHLTALLLAPLNVAWMLQSWLLLGAAAYGLGPARVASGEVGVLVWIAAATAVGQVAAWSIEGVRRLPAGVPVVRIATAAVAVAVAWLQLTGRLSTLLDRLPTRWFVVGLLGGPDLRWALTVAAELGMLVAATVIGAIPAHLTARLAAREEDRADSGVHRARPTAASDLAMLVRLDRGSVWRAVPMRRGLAVLALGPGVVALAGALSWSQLILLPGLVASGGALLFAVNAWCLEGRGVLWRESLPMAPGVVFAARAWVTVEFLAAASAITLGLGCLRAGVPDLSVAVALLAAWAVVLLQVLAGALRWSIDHPYAVDLRSARATPAPPVAMVGYSARLALTTTLTALVFTGLARVDAPALTGLVGLVLATWSWIRLRRTASAWADPVVRARVVMAVAG